ncbi:LGFP repeat-containing protein [Rhodococcus sp. OK611]|uniref:hypothetical protein n=1 Tax=unclassified Rhodococcus (in: high G+C Gram-positive bacteria) TaxID=192944 RepID=UPI000BD32978|nr:MULTISPECIES: hypothetical protein [unclassified Rhodococcus (in: high G+C Gram-positive bacteria)]PTR42022.1 LGFP repeat-containing protein [Rhodococcus sp. OK611]SNX91531.1 LGFP repeat-containing protein [Rhodococcus sp. OK270]
MTVQEIDRTGETQNYSSRWGARIVWFALHTEEGGSNHDPERLHDWMKRNSVSYHYLAGAGRLLGIVDTDYGSWSAGDANPRTINLVFVGSRAAMSRQQWLDEFADDIDHAAWVFVRDAKKYDPLDPVVLGQDYDAIGAGRSGGIDHSGITYGLGIGDHTDVGPNFPWDVFEDAVEKYVEGYVPPVVVPAPTAIDAEALIAKAWIGARITAGEESTPDGRGRYARFENGAIYWSPSTGAWAVPSTVLTTWAERLWEAGALGYPIGRHAVLTGADGRPVGDVQGFEGGAIYRRYGQPGAVVTGRIRERWNRSGFENGPLGWPLSDEVEVDGGGRVQEFEHGRIAWSPEGTTALTPVGGPDQVVPDPH